MYHRGIATVSFLWGSPHGQFVPDRPAETVTPLGFPDSFLQRKFQVIPKKYRNFAFCILHFAFRTSAR